MFRPLASRSEEHTSEPSHLVISYAVFCLKKKTTILYLAGESDSAIVRAWAASAGAVRAQCAAGQVCVKSMRAGDKQTMKTRAVFFNDTATTEIYTLSLHDALPISSTVGGERVANLDTGKTAKAAVSRVDRKSTRLNSSDLVISYAVFCLKKTKRGGVSACAAAVDAGGLESPRAAPGC